MDCADRLAAFERMLAAVQAEYDSTAARMEPLKAAGKEKTATYRQLMAARFELRALLARYQAFGLLDK